MKKSILEIYALVVCFIAVVCFAINSGVAIHNVIGIISPQFTMESIHFNKYQSNNAYWENSEHRDPITKKEIIRPPEEELTKKRLENYQIALKSVSRNALQNLTTNAIIIMLSIIFFIAHWRIAKRAQETNT